MGDADTVRATMQAYVDAGVDVPVLMPLPWGADRRASADLDDPRRRREGLSRWSSTTRSSSSPAAPTASAARCAERFAAEGVRGLAVVDRRRRGGRGRVAAELGPTAIGLDGRRRPRGRRRRRRARHRGALRADRPARVERRHRHRRRRRRPERGLAADLGRQRDGPRVRGPGGAPRHARPRRGLPPQHRVGRRAAHQHRHRALQRHQARRRRRWPSGSPSPTATRASRCRASARRACARTCSWPARTTPPAPWCWRRGAIEPEDVAEAVVQGLRAESFLILPHPEVLDLLPAQGRRLRPLARPACASCRRASPDALA